VLLSAFYREFKLLVACVREMTLKSIIITQYCIKAESTKQLSDMRARRMSQETKVADFIKELKNCESLPVESIHGFCDKIFKASDDRQS